MLSGVQRHRLSHVQCDAVAASYEGPPADQWTASMSGELGLGQLQSCACTDSPTQSEAARKQLQQEMQRSYGHSCIHGHANSAAEMPQRRCDSRVQAATKKRDAQQEQQRGATHSKQSGLASAFSESECRHGTFGLLDQSKACCIAAWVCGCSSVESAVAGRCQLYIDRLRGQLCCQGVVTAPVCSWRHYSLWHR